MDYEKFLIYFTLLILLASVALIGISFTIGKKITSSPTQPVAVCDTIKASDEGAINLVFFSPDKETAEKYTNYLLNFEPFSKYKDSFSSYFIQSSPDDCKYYKDKIALLCYSRDLLKKASVCPNDVVIVLKNDEPKIRSSAYMNVMSINTAHPSTVLTHEFGHVFAFLADEYVPATLPPKVKNCVKRCGDFNEKNDGCYEGCSKKDYIRSIDSGVMRSLNAKEYGKFDTYLIKEQLEQFETKKSVTGLATYEQRDCAEEQYYVFEAVYDIEQKKTTIVSSQIENGCAGGNGVGHFEYKIYDKDKKVIETGSFNPNLLFVDGPGEKEEIDGDVYEVSSIFLLKAPLLKDAKEIRITTEEKITGAKIGEILNKGVQASKGTGGGKAGEDLSKLVGGQPRESAFDVGPIETPSAKTKAQPSATSSTSGGGTVEGLIIFEKIGEKDFRNVLYVVIFILLILLIVILKHRNSARL